VKLFCVADQLIESGDAEKAAQLTIIAPVRAILRMSDSPLNEITGRLVVVSADATIPSRTAACVADGGSGHAGTVDHDHTRPATHTGLRDNAVWLRHWRGRHCLRSGSESQPEQSKHYCSDHGFLQAFHNSFAPSARIAVGPASHKILSSLATGTTAIAMTSQRGPYHGGSYSASACPDEPAGSCQAGNINPQQPSRSLQCSQITSAIREGIADRAELAAGSTR
jgi:hypothetical protein